MHSFFQSFPQWFSSLDFSSFFGALCLSEPLEMSPALFFLLFCRCRCSAFTLLLFFLTSLQVICRVACVCACRCETPLWNATCAPAGRVCNLHVIPPKKRIRARSDWVTPIKSRGPLCFPLIPRLLPSPCHDSVINHQWHNRTAHVPVAWPAPFNLYILIRIRREVNNEWGSPSGAANSILLRVTFHSHHSQTCYWA